MSLQRKADQLRAALGTRVDATWVKDGQIHARSGGEQLVAVPGGSFVLGLTPADESALAQIVTWTAGVSARVAGLRARGAQRVSVAPFLCGSVLHRARDASRCAMTYHDASAHADRLGLRLLSEAEYEWIARGGSTNASWALSEWQSVVEVTEPQWASSVLSGGSSQQPSGTVCGGSTELDPQSPEEHIERLAANRIRLDRAYFRLACSWPVN